MKYKNVLLLDDDPDDAELFITATKAVDEKIKSVVETNALDVLKKLNEATKFPDIIFLDYKMSYLDAGEFLELLRSIKGLKNIPIVLYSGHSGEAVKDLIKKHKKLLFLKKQSSFSDSIESLKAIIIS